MIHPTAIIHPNVIIGKNCRIEAHAVIGAPPEHREHFHSDTGNVVIGDNCIIREFVTIHSGINSPTTIGNSCILQRGAHVGHDCIVQDHVTLSCNTILGGHVVVMKYANIGLGAIIRQRLIVGPGVMVGMGAVVTSNLLPFITYVGNPAKPLKQNTLVVERNNLSDDEVKALGLHYYQWTKNQA